MIEEHPLARASTAGEKQPSMLGSVLKAIACTPNGNPDTADYQRRVLEPSQQLRKLWSELGDKRPSDEQLPSIMRTLTEILDAKRVEPQERDDRIREIAALHGVPASALPR